MVLWQSLALLVLLLVMVAEVAGLVEPVLIVGLVEPVVTAQQGLLVVEVVAQVQQQTVTILAQVAQVEMDTLGSHHGK